MMRGQREGGWWHVRVLTKRKARGPGTPYMFEVRAVGYDILSTVDGSVLRPYVP